MEEKNTILEEQRRISNKPSRSFIASAIIVSVLALLTLGAVLSDRYRIPDRIRELRNPGIKYVEVAVKVDRAKEAEEKKNKEIQKIAYCIQSLQPKQSYDSAVLIAKATHKECNEKGINIALWVALMFAESSLDPMKSNIVGAIGLCQVRYVVWKETPELMDNGVQIKDKLFWVDLNIKCATSIFKKYYEESGKKVGNALWRYNSGQTKLPENKRPYDIEYVAKIMYYTYKVNEILGEESVSQHPINDPEAQADVAGFVPPAAEHKDRPITKRSADKKEVAQ